MWIDISFDELLVTTFQLRWLFFSLKWDEIKVHVTYRDSAETSDFKWFRIVEMRFSLTH